MVSVTGTVCHGSRPSVLGTWSVAVPWTLPVAGSSARTVRVDGLPVALATRHRSRRLPALGTDMATATLLPSVSRPVT